LPTLSIWEDRAKIRRQPRTGIAAIRASKNPPWTQGDLADRLKCSPETVRRYETGGRDIDIGKIYEIAEALECQPYELLADKEQIIAEEAAYLAKQRKLLNAYENAGDSIKKAINELLFPSGGKLSEEMLKKRTG
jgi:transcriptional regulator with XRE-family HTH domain